VVHSRIPQGLLGDQPAGTSFSTTIESRRRSNRTDLVDLRVSESVGVLGWLQDRGIERTADTGLEFAVQAREKQRALGGATQRVARREAKAMTP